MFKDDFLLHNSSSFLYKLSQKENNGCHAIKKVMQYLLILLPIYYHILSFHILSIYYHFQAVKKSRFKTKQRTQETFTRVNKLKAENQMLEEKVKTLTKELQFLKELFLAHASNTNNSKFEGIDLDKLLEDIPEDKK